jgi:AcrR family transcriptional regulator
LKGTIISLVAKSHYKLTIADITTAAAVSRRTFYEHFSSKDDSVVAAVSFVLEEFSEMIASTTEGAELPRRVFIDSLLQFAQEEPDRCYVVAVEAMAADPASYEAMLDRCAEAAKTTPEVIAGILWTLRWRLKGKQAIDPSEFQALASVGFADPTKE